MTHDEQNVAKKRNMPLDSVFSLSVETWIASNVPNNLDAIGNITVLVIHYLTHYN